MGAIMWIVNGEELEFKTLETNLLIIVSRKTHLINMNSIYYKGDTDTYEKTQHLSLALNSERLLCYI